MEQALARTLGKLRQDKINRWPAESLGAAPYKPLFLLALCSLAGRPIFPPCDELFGPDPDNLKWRWKQSA